MNIVDGIRYGKKISSDKYVYLSEVFIGDHQIDGFGSSIILKNNLVAVDNLSEENASGGGVQGAAAGAVVGFLALGPVGTVVGALIGRKKKGRDGATLLLSWANGDYWIVNNVKPREIGILKSVIYASNHIQSLPKDKKNVQQESECNTKSTNKKSIGKPKQLPKHPPLKTEGGFEFIKGRSAASKTSLPKLALIKKLNNLDESKEAVKLFRRLFNDEIQNYNNWKWRHFDLKIEAEYEVEAVAKRTLLILISDVNETLITRRKVVKLRNELDNLQENINVIGAHVKEYKSALETKRKELAETGLFSKGPVKKEIQNIEVQLKMEQESLDKKLGSSSDTSKKIESLEKITKIDVTFEEFIAIYDEAFPNLLKPSKKLKIKFSFDNKFYLDTYRTVFDETWDKKINAALEKQKAGEEKEIAKGKSSTKEPSAKTKDSPKEVMSKKAQLNELNELLGEGLISDDEYESSRKLILGLS